jgi:lipoprotein-anchoring transpeptidase ErfK/SrfK
MYRGFLSTCALVLAVSFVPALEAQSGGASVRKKGSADRVKSGAQVLDAPSVNEAVWTSDIKAGAPAAEILRAQILLDRARYSPGEIDARFGRNTTLAVQGFQASEGLEPTGIVDERTWTLLAAAAQPALVPYVITKEDVAGPFEKIPADMIEKSKLKALSYESPQEALGEKFHIQPELLARLNPGKDLTAAGVEIMAPNVRTATPPGVAERVVVSKMRTVVQALAANGKVLAQYPATIGSDKDPLPLGTWKVTVVQLDPVFNYNPDLFWDADPSDSKARIAPGPNSPVGSVWIGLSKEHYGIHGTPAPGMIGHSESNGCIRLTNWDARDLAAMLKPGRQAILQEP